MSAISGVYKRPPKAVVGNMPADCILWNSETGCPFAVEQVHFSKCVKDAQVRNTIAAQTGSQKPLNERHFETARKVFYLMEENISKLGINPSIILRELDRTKESYLQTAI
ncbi:unnamed protein product, partial [Brenthis ino]